MGGRRILVSPPPPLLLAFVYVAVCLRPFWVQEWTWQVHIKYCMPAAKKKKEKENPLTCFIFQIFFPCTMRGGPFPSTLLLHPNEIHIKICWPPPNNCCFPECTCRYVLVGHGPNTTFPERNSPIFLKKWVGIGQILAFFAGFFCSDLFSLRNL